MSFSESCLEKPLLLGQQILQVLLKLSFLVKTGTDILKFQNPKNMRGDLITIFVHRLRKLMSHSKTQKSSRIINGPWVIMLFRLIKKHTH